MGSRSPFSKPSRSTIGIVASGITLIAVAGAAAVSATAGEPAEDYAASDYVVVDGTTVSRSVDRSAITLSPQAEIALAKAAAIDAQKAARLADEQKAAEASKPSAAENAPVAAPAPSGAPCASGSAVEAGLMSNAIAVHRAACANFSGIRSYGGRGGGDHASGRALDIMITGDAGWAVANYMRAHASELGISYVIYSQKIWSTERGSEGWRSMSDRGSATANHYDHVHVSTF